MCDCICMQQAGGWQAGGWQAGRWIMEILKTYLLLLLSHVKLCGIMFLLVSSLCKARAYEWPSPTPLLSPLCSNRLTLAREYIYFATSNCSDNQQMVR